MISNEVLQLTKQRLREHLAAKETSEDVIAWTRYMLGDDWVPYLKMQECARSVRTNRKTLVYGTNSSGKSLVMVGILSLWWYETKGVYSKTMIITPSGEQSKRNLEYVDELAQVIHDRYNKGLIDRDIKGKVVHDTTFSADKHSVIFARNPPNNLVRSTIKGGHSTVATLVILDEADGLSDLCFSSAEDVNTGRNDRIVAITNPTDPGSFILREVQTWKDTGKSTWNIWHFGWFDMPAYTGEKVSQRQTINLLQKEYVDDKIERFGIDSAQYNIKVLGEPDYEDGLTLIRSSDINAGKLAEYPRSEDEPEPRPILGVDLAMFGNDSSVIYAGWTKPVEFIDEDEYGKQHKYIRNMTRIRLIDSITTNDVDQRSQARWCLNHAQAIGAKEIRFDAMGVGQTFVRTLEDEMIEQEVYDIRMVKMIASGRDMYKDIYVNNRAYFAGNARDRLHNGEIDIDPDDVKLIKEALSIKYKEDTLGRIQLQSKREAVGKASPDHFDAFTYAAIEDDNIVLMLNGNKPKQEIRYEETGASDWSLYGDDPFLDYIGIDDNFSMNNYY